MPYHIYTRITRRPHQATISMGIGEWNTSTRPERRYGGVVAAVTHVVGTLGSRSRRQRQRRDRHLGFILEAVISTPPPMMEDEEDNEHVELQN